MRLTLEFLGLMALGMMVAIGTAVLTSGATGSGVATGLGTLGSFDLIAFAGGLATGIVLTSIARLGWSELPRRAIGWLVGMAANLRMLLLACLLVAILVLY